MIEGLKLYYFLLKLPLSPICSCLVYTMLSWLWIVFLTMMVDVFAAKTTLASITEFPAGLDFHHEDTAQISSSYLPQYTVPEFLNPPFKLTSEEKELHVNDAQI